MKDDIRKYLPTMGTALKETESGVIQDRLRKARESRPSIPVTSTPAPGTIDCATPDEVTVPRGEADDETTVPRGSAPSPWAEAGAEPAIDRAMLPSAAAPVTEPVTKPVVRSERPADAKRRFPTRWLLMLAIVGIGGPIAVLSIAKSMRERAPTAATPSATGNASATASPSSTATAATSAVDAPRAATSSSAAAVESATSSPREAPPVKAPPRPRRPRQAPDAGGGSDQDQGLNE